MNANEVAAATGNHVNAIIHLADRGEVPPYRLVDGRAEWDTTEVRRWCRQFGERRRRDDAHEETPRGYLPERQRRA